MAAAISRYGCLALRCTSRIPSRRKPLLQSIPVRSLHVTPSYRDEKDSKESVDDTSLGDTSSDDTFFSDHEKSAAYDLLSPEEKALHDELEKEYHERMNSPEFQAELNAEVSKALYESFRDEPAVDERTPRVRTGAMGEGEIDAEDFGPDPEFEGDDISSLGHGELEQHREKRHYARIAAWEMPMLSKLAKPFSPPPLDHPLRFRYTTYMGENHPAEKKIVLEFCTRDLPGLTEPQRIKLIKLVGPRYNPISDIVKMSCEMFETQAQNKRYLGDLVDTLMAEAKDDKEMFEDVPLDFRHHKFKPPLEFPESWKMTPQRKQQLEAQRQQRMLEAQARELKGQIVDGMAVIEEAVKARNVVIPRPGPRRWLPERRLQPRQGSRD